MKPIIKYSLFFVYFLCYLSIVSTDYNLLERSLNNMNTIDIIYDSLKPLYRLSFMPVLLLFIFGFKNKKIWLMVIFIIFMQSILPRYQIDIFKNDLYKIFGIFIYLTLISILIIRKIKIKKYIYGILVLLISLFLVFLSEKTKNNIGRQECLEQKIELIVCKETYYMDRIFYDKLLEIEANTKPN